MGWAAGAPRLRGCHDGHQRHGERPIRRTYASRGGYQFSYDITDKIQFGKDNRLEVLVNKVSANPAIEKAERGGDYWVFGGIYRPVWLEARPPQAIDWTTIDASADGFGREWIIHLEKARPTVELGRVMGTLKALGVRLSIEPQAHVDSAIDLNQILGEYHNSKS